MQSTVVHLADRRGIDLTMERVLATAELGPDAVTGLDLRGADFSGTQLMGIDLSGVDLTGANFSRADLTGARFRGSRLRGALLHRSTLEESDLSEADLSGADLSEVRGAWADFSGASLRKVRGLGAQLVSACFESSDLSAADLRGAHLTRAVLFGARLTEADLEGADLRSADFEHCQVDGASLRETDLQGARFRSLVGWKEADWIMADLRGGDFSGSRMLEEHAKAQSWWWEWSRRSRLRKMVHAAWEAVTGQATSYGRPLFALLTVVAAFAMLWMWVPVEGQTPLSPFMMSLWTLLHVPTGVVPLTTAGKALAVCETLVGWVFMLAVFHGMASYARRA